MAIRRESPMVGADTEDVRAEWLAPAVPEILTP